MKIIEPLPSENSVNDAYNTCKRQQEDQKAIVETCDLLFSLSIPYFLCPQLEFQLARVCFTGWDDLNFNS